MRNHNIIQKLSLIALVLFTFSCNKLEIPNEEVKAIFGQWRYHSSAGGASGTGVQGLNANHWVEFTSKGIYTLNENNTQREKSRFRFEKRNSVLGGERMVLLFQISTSKVQSFEFSGDTLILNDETIGGFTYKYIKK